MIAVTDEHRAKAVATQNAWGESRMLDIATALAMIEQDAVERCIKIATGHAAYLHLPKPYEDTMTWRVSQEIAQRMRTAFNIE